jgi:hypothetical protein
MSDEQQDFDMTPEHLHSRFCDISVAGIPRWKLDELFDDNPPSEWELLPCGGVLPGAFRGLDDLYRF